MPQEDKNCLPFNDYKMAYKEFGNGDNVLFAFHGFGRDADDFKIIEPSLGAAFRIVSFDLFYHGRSDSPENPEQSNYLDIDLKEMIDQYLLKNNIKTFSLLGYSLGGRICLKLIELYPDKIENAFLFAPAGLNESWTYDAIIGTKLGRWLFKNFITNPKPFFIILKTLKSLGLINNSVYKFFHLQLDTEKKRLKVYDTHLFYRHIIPQWKIVIEHINNEKMNFHLFFGRHDTIIPPSIGKRFIRKIHQKKSLHILESGHHLLKDSLNDVLIKLNIIK